MSARRANWEIPCKYAGQKMSLTANGQTNATSYDHKNILGTLAYILDQRQVVKSKRKQITKLGN